MGAINTSSEIGVQVNKDGRRSYKCGCVATIGENGVWQITTYCDTHTPNYQKKADKLIHKEKRKTGRDYTKPALTKKFLKKRRGR